MTIIIPPPGITCPVALPPVTAINGQSTVVSYALPTVTGGTAPVSLSCAPPSGSTFTVGSTSVTCSATDAVHRTAACSFAVTVVPPVPRLGVTTILAFGDSLTEGEVPVAGEFSIRPQFVEPDKSYPAGLTNLLAQRYTAQDPERLDAFTLLPGNMTNCWTDPPRQGGSGILVVNAGCNGAEAQDPNTLTRFNDKLATYHPDVVLLLLGTDDLDPSRPDASIAAGVQGVRTLIAAAQSRGARVMVGTLPPQIAMDLTHGGAPGLVVPFNMQLIPLANGMGATVVDLYGDLVTDETDWISPYDGFHLTEGGYQEMARVWLNAVRNSFELAPSSTRPSGLLKGCCPGIPPGRPKRP